MKQPNVSKSASKTPFLPICETDNLANPTKASIHDAKVDTNNNGLVIDSDDLFAGQKILTIEHNGSNYLLRITRENKLILTK